MHPTARLYRVNNPTEVTAIRIADSPDVLEAILSLPCSPQWNDGSLTIGHMQGYAGDYIVQRQEGDVQIVPAEAFEKTHEADELPPDPTTQHALYILYGTVTPEDLTALLQYSQPIRPGHTALEIHTDFLIENPRPLTTSEPTLIAPTNRAHPYRTRFRASVPTENLAEVIAGHLKPDHDSAREQHQAFAFFRAGIEVPRQLRNIHHLQYDVTYRDRDHIVSSNNLRDALSLMAQIRSEELDAPVQPRSLTDIPLHVLDRFGRAVTTSWLAHTVHKQHAEVHEPTLHYPEPGLVGHLNLWGLTPQDLFSMET